MKICFLDFFCKFRGQWYDQIYVMKMWFLRQVGYRTNWIVPEKWRWMFRAQKRTKRNAKRIDNWKIIEILITITKKQKVIPDASFEEIGKLKPFNKKHLKFHRKFGILDVMETWKLYYLFLGRWMPFWAFWREKVCPSPRTPHPAALPFKSSPLHHLSSYHLQFWYHWLMHQCQVCPIPFFSLPT